MADDRPLSGGILPVLDGLEGDLSGFRYNSSNYEELQNKPSIGGVTLIGDKTPEELGIKTDTATWGKITGDLTDQDDLQVELHDRDTDALSVQEIEAILYLG